VALPNVSIILQNGQLGGLIQFAEGVAALVGTGSAVSGKIGVGDPRVVFSLQEAEDLGITVADNPKAYRQVKEFYDEAGSGAELYIMLVPDTMEQTEIMDVTNTSGAVKLLNYAQGRVRMLGSFFAPPVGYTLVDTAGLDADVFTAITKAQALGNAYALNNTPVRCIVEGRGYSGVAANLTNLRSLTANRVGVMAAGTLNDKSASVGLILGRFAKNPVQRKPSRVKDGAVNVLTAFVGTAKVEAHSGIGVMHDKGYMVLRTFNGKTGYYFSGDPTAAATTDDYCQFARGRVIDKAHVIAYLTYLEELDDEIAVNADGTLELGALRFLEKKIENQIAESMVAAGEISSVTCTIAPNQNIIANNKLSVVLAITPVGYASNIEVKLGFQNPANQ
jgi:hypothetical protein